MECAILFSITIQSREGRTYLVIAVGAVERARAGANRSAGDLTWSRSAHYPRVKGHCPSPPISNTIAYADHTRTFQCVSQVRHEVLS
jgi:hypothetical protein